MGGVVVIGKSSPYERRRDEFRADSRLRLDAARSQAKNPMSAAKAPSALTCPVRTHSKRKLPGDRCLFCSECERCQALRQAKVGHCCVFCSINTVPCPPKRLAPG
jgi:hypothetical protein